MFLIRISKPTFRLCTCRLPGAPGPDFRTWETTNLEGPPASPFADHLAPGAENVSMPSLVQVDSELQNPAKNRPTPPPHPVENTIFNNEYHLNTNE